MRLFGLDIRRSKTLQKAAVPATDLSAFSRGWRRIAEIFPGGWQRDLESVGFEQNVLTHAAVYACVRLISTDVGKLRIKLDEETSPGIWTETTNSAYSPVLRKPNHYQTRIQFLERWVTSKLLNGNTYVLKEREQNNRQLVRAMYILDPNRVKTLVTPSGDVYYDIQSDNLARVGPGLIVPATEIIHDRMMTPYHDLCGVSPLAACALAAIQGLNIQNNSTQLFSKGLQPPGILTVLTPGALSPEEATKIQNDWETGFGRGPGAVAVLPADMKYQQLSMNAVDSQLIEQLKWTAEIICSAFGVPAYMVGVGPVPAYNNVEALSLLYYQQCLQTLIENIEVLLDEGLGLSEQLGTELDLRGLLRMDSAARVTAAKEAITGGGQTVNEAREEYYGLGPVSGGNVVLAQTQNASLDFIKRRDELGPLMPAATPAKPASLPPAKELTDLEFKAEQNRLRKNLELAA